MLMLSPRGCTSNTGIAPMTPHAVHYGRAAQLQVVQAKTLLEAHQAHPERFPGGTPAPGPCPRQPGSTNRQFRPRPKRGEATAQMFLEGVVSHFY